jgi:hypothetical protein
MPANTNGLADHSSGQRGRAEIVRGPDAGARSASFRAGRNDGFQEGKETINPIDLVVNKKIPFISDILEVLYFS